MDIYVPYVCRLGNLERQPNMILVCFSHGLCNTLSTHEDGIDAQFK